MYQQGRLKGSLARHLKNQYAQWTKWQVSYPPSLLLLPTSSLMLLLAVLSRLPSMSSLVCLPLFFFLFPSFFFFFFFFPVFFYFRFLSLLSLFFASFSFVDFNILIKIKGKIKTTRERETRGLRFFWPDLCIYLWVENH